MNFRHDVDVVVIVFHSPVSRPEQCLSGVIRRYLMRRDPSLLTRTSLFINTRGG